MKEQAEQAAQLEKLGAAVRDSGTLSTAPLSLVFQYCRMTTRFTRTAIPLRSIAAGELGRYVKIEYVMKILDERDCNHCGKVQRVRVQQNWNAVTTEDLTYVPSLESRMPGWFSYAYHCVVCGQYVCACSEEEYEAYRRTEHSA